MANNTTIQLHFPPHFIREYGEKMLATAKEGKNNGPAELAMLEDIVKLLRIAEGVLAPSGSDSRKSK